jgi:hypothetical protein
MRIILRASGKLALCALAVIALRAQTTFTTLYSFCLENGCADGEGPGGLAQGLNGDFYGITAGSDEPNAANGSSLGTVFKISPAGTTGQGGANPAPDGFDGGTVFQLSLGLGRFVKVQPAIGVAGELVDILGTDLTDATSVTFNGTTAVFRVVSSSLIVAKVPSGATSGTIEVITPGATLKGNVPFEVWP